jgi:hypothetical protein
MTDKPLNITADRKTWTGNTRTGESVDIAVHDLDQDDIGVNVQNHRQFSTLAIIFGNVKLTCFTKPDTLVNDDDLCTENLQVIDTLINKLIDVEQAIRIELRERARNKAKADATNQQAQLTSVV